MIFLAEFNPILPDVGIVFWTFLVFLLVWTVLGRYAFRPIQNALKKREESIKSALDQADQAKADMANMQSKNEQLLKQAQEERTKILREAKELKDAIVKDAKGQAKTEAQKIVADAKQDIENMKNAALTDAKNELGSMAIEIAEKVIRQQLEGDKAQEALVANMVKEIKFN